MITTSEIMLCVFCFEFSFSKVGFEEVRQKDLYESQIARHYVNLGHAMFSVAFEVAK